MRLRIVNKNLTWRPTNLTNTNYVAMWSIPKFNRYLIIVAAALFSLSTKPESLLPAQTWPPPWHTSVLGGQAAKVCGLYSPHLFTNRLYPPPPFPWPLASFWIQLTEGISKNWGKQKRYIPAVSVRDITNWLCPSTKGYSSQCTSLPVPSLRVAILAITPNIARALFSTQPGSVPSTCPSF